MSSIKEPLRKLNDSFSLKDVGSTLLEDLAKGLYQADEVLREYIQNAVDAHRSWINTTGYDPEGPIQIEIRDKKISIIDYGIGMNEEEIRKVKSIAISPKRDADFALTGHKGVGIWAGLSYFEKITLISTKKNNDKLYKLDINFKRIVDSISYKNDIGEALNPNYAIYEYNEDVNSHYTIVTLESPTKLEEKFLNNSNVRDAVRRICPCEVDPTFVFHNELNEWYRKNNFEKYNVEVNGEAVYRSFPSNVTDFQTGEIKIGNTQIALFWKAINQRNRTLEKKEDQIVGFHVIQTGFTLGAPNLYSERNLPGYEELKIVSNALNWYVGEIHIILEELRPNLRRNQFEESEISRQFVEKLRLWYKDLEYDARVISYRRSAIELYREVEATIIRLRASGYPLNCDPKDITYLKEAYKDINKQTEAIEKSKNKRNVVPDIKAYRETIPQRNKAKNCIESFLNEESSKIRVSSPNNNGQKERTELIDNIKNDVKYVMEETIDFTASSSDETKGGNGSSNKNDDLLSSENCRLKEELISIDLVQGILDSILIEYLPNDTLIREKIVKTFCEKIKYAR